MYGGEVHTGVWWRNLRERDHLEGPRHRWENNMKIDLYEMGWGAMDWNVLVQNRDRWQALIYVLINLQVPQNVGDFLAS